MTPHWGLQSVLPPLLSRSVDAPLALCKTGSRSMRLRSEYASLPAEEEIMRGFRLSLYFALALSGLVNQTLKPSH